MRGGEEWFAVANEWPTGHSSDERREHRERLERESMWNICAVIDGFPRHALRAWLAGNDKLV